MSWWNKLLGSSKKQHASELRFPLVIEIVPGALSAMVHSHKLSLLQGEILCWSFVSKGLKAVEHPELVITLRREVDEPEDAFPDDPLQLLMALHQIAGQGKRVGPGEVSELGGKRFFGHHLVYARAQPLGDVVLPPGCLAALPVNDEELRAVRDFGATRVLARMGEAARYFPVSTLGRARSHGPRVRALVRRQFAGEISPISFGRGQVQRDVAHERRVVRELHEARGLDRHRVAAIEPAALAREPHQLDEVIGVAAIDVAAQVDPAVIGQPIEQLDDAVEARRPVVAGAVLAPVVAAAVVVGAQAIERDLGLTDAMAGHEAADVLGPHRAVRG